MSVYRYLLTAALVAFGPAAAAKPEMIRVPAGEAHIGSDRGWPDERPTFTVQVAAFDLDRTPVTVAAFRQFVTQTGYVTCWR